MDFSNIITSSPNSPSIKAETPGPLIPGSPSPSSDLPFWKKLDATKIVLIILLLAFLGYNLFTYLVQATDTTTGIFGPVIQKIAHFFGTTTGDVVKTTVDTSAEGTKAAVDVAAGTVTTSVDLVQKGIGAPTNVPVSNQQQELERALTHAEKTQDTQEEIRADETDSNIQHTTSGKAGYCYVGTDRGFRSCVKVNANDVCTSGDIYPSKDLCVNPNLRE